MTKSPDSQTRVPRHPLTSETGDEGWAVGIHCLLVPCHEVRGYRIPLALLREEEDLDQDTGQRKKTFPRGKKRPARKCISYGTGFFSGLSSSP